jgi:hypothetical protein
MRLGWTGSGSLGSKEVWAIDGVRSFVFGLGMSYGFQEFPPLFVEDSQIWWKHAQEQGFDVVAMFGVEDPVPTKVVPRLTASLAPAGVFNPPLNISLSYVHWG